MGKTILTFALVLVISFLNEYNCLAQTAPKDEIEVGIGALTVPGIANVATEVFSSVFSLGSYTTQSNSTGSLTAGYKHRVAGHLDLGGLFLVNHISQTIYHNDTQTGSGHINWTALMGTLDYNWVDHQSFRLYSGLALGASIYKKKQENNSGQTMTQSNTYLAFQANLLGAKLGKSFSGGLMLGFGYEGLIGLNLGYRF
ncbi:MAG TPA: hypothetical protein VJ964_10560 [Balneolaceae bacterium]|nr:hypothetical protein [Balneolaceae bacterium]